MRLYAPWLHQRHRNWRSGAGCFANGGKSGLNVCRLGRRAAHFTGVPGGSCVCVRSLRLTRGPSFTRLQRASQVIHRLVLHTSVGLPCFCRLKMNSISVEGKRNIVRNHKAFHRIPRLRHKVGNNLYRVRWELMRNTSLGLRPRPPDPPPPTDGTLSSHTVTGSGLTK